MTRHKHLGGRLSLGIFSDAKFPCKSKKIEILCSSIMSSIIPQTLKLKS